MTGAEYSLEAFGNWLGRTTKLHRNSIYRYVHAVGTIAEFLRVNTKLGDLLSITDHSFVDKARTQYFSDPENRRKNDDGNNMYSAALNHYERFVEYLTDDDVDFDRLDLETDDKIDYAIDGPAFDETRKRYFLHLRTERKPMLVSAAKTQFRRIHDHLFCEKCGFNRTNGEIYGDMIIEGHHLLTVSILIPSRIDENTAQNIMMLCPNCHRKVHVYMTQNGLGEMGRDAVANVSL